MSTVFEFTGRVPSKKNSRVTVRATGRSFPSKDYGLWHKAQMASIMQQKEALPKVIPRYNPRPTKFGVTIFLRFPTLGRADLTNKAESIMDLLVDAGILRDDSWICVPMLTLFGTKDAANPGATVIIKEFIE
jgi:hypothetical protein